MASHNTSHQNKILAFQSKGFTLIEIMIAMAILTIILSIGLFISFDFYRSYAFRSEKNTIVSALQKARNQSLNNIDQAKHGVHFEANPSLAYTIFEGSSYDKNNPSNLVINASYGISITSETLPFDVIFDQLSAASLNKTITVSDGVTSYDININNEGRIDW